MAVADAFAAAPNYGLPWLRFPSPLIEPDLWISRIRICASEGKKHLPSITATSAYGYKQTSSRPKMRSALPPAPDILDRVGNDRL